MNYINSHQIYFALILYAILLATAFLTKKFIKTEPQHHRFESLDGFRGILAISVFIHHAAIWKLFIDTGKWDSPDEIFYCHLGSTSVSFFFMITSFLFINKLLKDSEKKDFDGKAFFISRFFRIVPLYYFSVLLILLVTLTATNFEIISSLRNFLSASFNWSTFNIYKKVPFNKFFEPSLPNSGVEWSLSYEWLFYFFVPLLSILFVKSIKKKILYSVISIVLIAVFLRFHHYLLLRLLYPFIGGMIAPFILKYFPLASKKIANNKLISMSIILLLVILLNSRNHWLSLIISMYIFTVIALGNNVFGVLKSSVLKFLGEISYSTYLLHGIILFVGLYLIIGLENLKNHSDFKYTITIFSISPFIVIISTITYNLIEAPFIKIGKNIIKKSSK